MSRINILSIDGGGIRGIIAAVWLDKLQARLDQPLHEKFNLIAGTSTGSILAAGVAMGIQPREILDLYLNKRHTVFPERWPRIVSRLKGLFRNGISAPKYDGTGLDSVLKDVLGETTRLEDVLSQLLVTSYDVRRRVPLVFNSLHPEHRDKPLWSVCRASSSAPTYFPAHKFQLTAIHPLVDGGVVANNPSVVALAEGIRLTHENGSRGNDSSGEKILLASFGTGQCTREITIRQSQAWGALQWGIPILDVMFDGSATINDRIARRLVAEGNYFRFQVPLKKGSDAMDDVSDVNVNNLVSVAETYLQSPAGSEKLDDLVEQLNC